MVVVVVIVIAMARAARPCGQRAERAMAMNACMRQQYRMMVHCVKSQVFALAPLALLLPLQGRNGDGVDVVAKVEIIPTQRSP
jgi:hypothetical protein